MKRGRHFGLAVIAAMSVIWTGIIGTMASAGDPPPAAEFCLTCHTGGPDGSMADEHHSLVVTKSFSCFLCHEYQVIAGGVI